MQHHRAYDLALIGMVASLDDAEPERAAVVRRTPRPYRPGRLSRIRGMLAPVRRDIEEIMSLTTQRPSGKVGS